MGHKGELGKGPPPCDTYQSGDLQWKLIHLIHTMYKVDMYSVHQIGLCLYTCWVSTGVYRTVQFYETKGQKFLHRPGTNGQPDNVKILPSAGTGREGPGRAGTVLISLTLASTALVPSTHSSYFAKRAASYKQHHRVAKKEGEVLSTQFCSFTPSLVFMNFPDNWNQMIIRTC